MRSTRLVIGVIAFVAISCSAVGCCTTLLYRPHTAGASNVLRDVQGALDGGAAAGRWLHHVGRGCCGRSSTAAVGNKESLAVPAGAAALHHLDAPGTSGVCMAYWITASIPATVRRSRAGCTGRHATTVLKSGMSVTSSDA
jgi:hypothetical protein